MPKRPHLTEEQKAKYNIQTSYFGKSATHPEAVSISVGTPRWFRGQKAPALAPTWAMLKMSSVEYDVHFQKILDKLDPFDVIEKVNGKVLLCWEKAGERCHRRIVADWIEEHTGLYVPELGYAKGELHFETIEEADARRGKKHDCGEHPKPVRKRVRNVKTMDED